MISTIGHSNRSIVEFLDILKAYAIEFLVDVRTVAKSRYNPQFNREVLPGSLAAVSVQYVHLPGLGGLRKPRKDSTNTGWRNDSFRGYADYMQTAEFEESVGELLTIETGRRVAIMCAEAVPWRCHRSLIADALTARGIPVVHLMSPVKADPHKLTSFARVACGRVSYPSPDLDLF